jgi:hypothetical protein
MAVQSMHGSRRRNAIAEGDIDSGALRNADGGSRNLKRLPFLGERICRDDLAVFRLRMPDAFPYFEMQAENFPMQLAGGRPIIVGYKRRKVPGTKWNSREQNHGGSQ